MALIGDQIPGYVQEQIKARQRTHGSGVLSDRTDQQLAYLNSKTAFIKLASGVSVSETKLQDMGYPQDFIKNNKGMGLAKNHVLFGGYSTFEPITKKEGILNQRDTFLGKNGAYEGYTDWGIIPMPGIESIEVKSLTRGSLKKATVKLTAQNRDQLAILDLLYLRLGYTVMIEWGWGIYLKNPKPGETDETLKSGTVEKMYTSIIEDLENGFFKKVQNGSYLEMLPRIEKARNDYSGNVDALLGKISNFNWSFNPDGSYSIEITILSLGDVVESLKTNIPATSKTLEYVNSNSVGWIQENDSLDQHRKDNIILSLLHVFRLQNLAPTGKQITITTEGEPTANMGNLLITGPDSISASEHNLNLTTQYFLKNNLTGKIVEAAEIARTDELGYLAYHFGSRKNFSGDTPQDYKNVTDRYIDKTFTDSSPVYEISEYDTSGDLSLSGGVNTTNFKRNGSEDYFTVDRTHFPVEGGNKKTSTKFGIVAIFQSATTIKTYTTKTDAFNEADFQEYQNGIATKNPNVNNPINKAILEHYHNYNQDTTIDTRFKDVLYAGASANFIAKYKKNDIVFWKKGDGSFLPTHIGAPASDKLKPLYDFLINPNGIYQGTAPAATSDLTSDQQVLLKSTPSFTTSGTVVFPNPLRNTNYQEQDCFVLKTTIPNYYIRFGYLLEILKTKVITRINTGQTKREDNPNLFKIDNGPTPMLRLPLQISFDWKTCIVASPFYRSSEGGWNQTLFPELSQWTGGGNSANAMNIYLNFNFIADQVSSNLDVKGNLSTYDFIKAICDGVNRALGGVNNLEPIIDEEDNTLKIFDSTPRAKTSSTSPDYILRLYGYKATGGNYSAANFVRKVDLKTAITPEYATMITVGATAGGYVKGIEATAFSRWNTGLTDRFKTELIAADPDVGKDEKSSREESADNFFTAMSWTAQCFGLQAASGDTGGGKIWELFP
jgi:hypothetical protein